MANLITEKQKKIIKIDYFIRLLSIYLIVPIALLGIFLLAYIIPYYISVSQKNIMVAEQFKSVINVENKENVGVSASSIMTQTQDEMKAIKLYNNSRLNLSDSLAKIIASKNSNIQITRLSFTFSKSGQAIFIVSGISKDREGLVSFIDDLKGKAGFSKVDSPISNFAKNSDISFDLNIQPKI